MPASARNLILSNIATLVAALLMHGSVGSLLWPYWIQSVIVGWYARKRIAHLDTFSTEGVKYGGRPLPEEDSSKRLIARFFSFHYGFFHLVYFMFIVSMDAIGSPFDLLALCACGISFALSQHHTYAVQHAADLRGKPNIGNLMATPYLRIVPVQASIVLGSKLGGAPALIGFVALKTASDLLLDLIDRRMAVRAADKAATATTTEPPTTPS